VVTTPVLLANNLIIIVDIRCEAVLPPAVRTSKSGCLASIFEKMVTIFHSVNPPPYKASAVVDLVPLVPFVPRVEQAEQMEQTPVVRQEW